MYCPSCGKATADGSAFCMYCGKATGIDSGGVTSAVVAQPSSNAPVCPSCGQLDAVRHIKSVAGEGLVSFDSESRSETRSWGTGTSIGADFHRLGDTSVWGLAGSVQSSSGLSSSMSQTQGTSMNMLVTLLKQVIEGSEEYNRQLMTGAPAPHLDQADALAYRKAELKFRNTLLQMGMRERLDRLFVCMRDAVVFVPGEGEFAPIDRMERIIYRYIDVSQHDYCRLYSWAWFEKVGLLTMSVNRVLWALAYGTEGIYVASQANWLDKEDQRIKLDRVQYIEGFNPSLKNNGGSYTRAVGGWVQDTQVHLFPSCHQCTGALKSVTDHLHSTGWRKIDENVKFWDEGSYVRPRALSNATGT